MRITKRKFRSKPKEVWPIVILKDDREKKGWTIKHVKFEVKKQRLAIGDYTLAGHDNVLAIEKKSGLKEFIGNITGKKKHKFEDFLERLSRVPFSCIIIEDSLGNVNRVFEQLPRSGLGPKDVYYWLFRIIFEFRIPVLFCDLKGFEKQNLLYQLFSVANNILGRK